ncbi:hypothetical protein [Ornithinimicrobium faecis]|uniref:hypothetical protein n=1 Tax=Ornithinimicrobium faecis TaxID=2934158 RepID=UPI002119AE91|nr:hypothetical protein [Ornithinimicrobium sp. HY1745]
MIRDRLEQDLAPLCSALEALAWPPGAGDEAARRAWLLEVSADQSWVFDAAPVSVAPTRNVQGHVQIFAPGEPDASLVSATGMDADALLVIGRLLVRPGPHAEGIRRFLLTEALRRVGVVGKTAILDLASNPGLTESLCHKRGLRLLPTTVPGLSPMIHHEEPEVPSR